MHCTQLWLSQPGCLTVCTHCTHRTARCGGCSRGFLLRSFACTGWADPRSAPASTGGLYGGLPTVRPACTWPAVLWAALAPQDKVLGSRQRASHCNFSPARVSASCLCCRLSQRLRPFKPDTKSSLEVQGASLPSDAGCTAWITCPQQSVEDAPMSSVRWYHDVLHACPKQVVDDLTSSPVGWSATPPGRVMVVLLMMRPSMPSFMDTAAMSDLSASVRSGAILTSRGGGPLRPHCMWSRVCLTRFMRASNCLRPCSALSPAPLCCCYMPCERSHGNGSLHCWQFSLQLSQTLCAIPACMKAAGRATGSIPPYRDSMMASCAPKC